MVAAKDRLIFPLDVSTAEQAWPLIETLSGAVGMFKVGLELFIRSGPRLVSRIREETGAGIFLDLKLHDIPETVRRAMAAVAALDVALATVHCGESSAMLRAAVDGSAGKVKVLGVTVLTSVCADDLRTAGFCEDPAALASRRAAAAKAAGLSGVVCSGREVPRIKEACGADFLCVTPGIRPGWQAVGADDQQRVCTPGEAVRRGADYIVVGRPIRDARDPREAALRISQEVAAVISD